MEQKRRRDRGWDERGDTRQVRNRADAQGESWTWKLNNGVQTMWHSEPWGKRHKRGSGPYLGVPGCGAGRQSPSRAQAEPSGPTEPRKQSLEFREGILNNHCEYLRPRRWRIWWHKGGRSGRLGRIDGWGDAVEDTALLLEDAELTETITKGRKKKRPKKKWIADLSLLGRYQAVYTYKCSYRRWRERVRQKKRFKEKQAKNFPNLMATINPHVEESQQILSRRNMKKTRRKPIIILLKSWKQTNKKMVHVWHAS